MATIFSLPVEVLLHVTTYLDINSTRLLRRVVVASHSVTKHDKAGYKAVECACNDRMSIIRYLEPTFLSPEDLLDTMSKNYAYVLGARSLEFFTPGTADSASPWDFYIPSQEYYLGCMMSGLQNAGVSWETYEDELKRNLETNANEFQLHGSKLRDMRRRGVLSPVLTSMGVTNAADIVPKVDHWCEIKVVDDKMLIRAIEPEEKTDDWRSDERRSVAAIGHIRCHKNLVPVRIMVEEREHGYEYPHSLFDFHSSCLQSFIGPFMSCHLYGGLACGNITYGWSGSLTDSDNWKLMNRLSDAGFHSRKSVPAWNSLIEAGFHYTNPSFSKVDLALRRSTDRESTLVKHRFRSKAPPSLRDLYDRCVKNIVWSEQADRTIKMMVRPQDMYGYDEYSHYSWVTQSFTVEFSDVINSYVPMGLVFVGP